MQYAEGSKGNHGTRSYGLKFWDRRDDFSLRDLPKVDDSLKNLQDTYSYLAIQKMEERA